MAKRAKHFTTCIDYPALRAEKARLGLEYTDIINGARLANGTAPESTTVARFLRSDEHLRVDVIIQLTAQLGLRPRITFEPIGETSEIGSAK